MDKPKTPPVQEVLTKVKLIQEDLFMIKNDIKIIKLALKEKEKPETISKGWLWFGEA